MGHVDLLAIPGLRGRSRHLILWASIVCGSLLDGSRDQPIPNGLLARELVSTANGLRFLQCSLVRRFLVRASVAHLSGHARDRLSVRVSNYLGIRLEPMRVVNSFLALALIALGQARGPHLASG